MCDGCCMNKPRTDKYWLFPCWVEDTDSAEDAKAHEENKQK